MKVFWPSNIEDEKRLIDRLANIPTLPPFHPATLAFLRDFSKQLLTNRKYRNQPELVALGYWLRKSHLVELESKFKERNQGKMMKPRGTVLHFAPSNVDTIFVYSWVLSMLAGNLNMLRVSSKKNEQTEQLIELVCSLFAKKEHEEVAKRTILFTYEHDREITAYLSKHCHVRVIWGGDETVQAIRSVPLAPLASEIVFPDRSSLCAIKASAVDEIDDNEFEQLIHHFFNDSFTFNQMACSSPKILAWIGDAKTVEMVKKKFWGRLEQYVSHQMKAFLPALQVEKLATGYYLSIEKGVKQFAFYSHAALLQTEELTLELRERHCGGGFFIEMLLDDLEQLAVHLVDKDQTLSYYGFTYEELVRFFYAIPNRAIDRIVPIGQALHFDNVWDGFDLLTYFTRETVIR